MDVTALATVSYAPGQIPAGSGSVRADARRATSNASSNERLAQAAVAPASAEAQKAREEAARKKDPTAEVTANPGITFEYEDKHEVMKVHNVKGILIYQVPSKGQLALIDAEESGRKKGQQLQLVA